MRKVFYCKQKIEEDYDATALRFPMNVLFERYVYKKLRHHCGGAYIVENLRRKVC